MSALVNGFVKDLSLMEIISESLVRNFLRRAKVVNMWSERHASTMCFSKEMAVYFCDEISRDFFAGLFCH